MINSPHTFTMGLYIWPTIVRVGMIPNLTSKSIFITDATGAFGDDSITAATLMINPCLAYVMRVSLGSWHFLILFGLMRNPG